MSSIGLMPTVSTQVATAASFALLPPAANNPIGAERVTLNDGKLYVNNGTAWVPQGGDGTGTVTSIDVSGGTTGLTTTGGPVTTAGVITLAGTVNIAHGGTNSTTTLNNNRVMKSSGGAIIEAAAITAARALISDANGIPTHSTTTSTELGYVSGVTSAIQTQLNGKVYNPTSITATSNTVLSTGNGDLYIFASSSGGAFNITLPDPTTNVLRRIIVKDTTGSFSTNNVTLVRFGSENIENLAANYVMVAAYGSLTIVSDGTNWFFT